MNTAKHLKDLNLRSLPKKLFRFWIKEFGPAIIIAIVIGTCLDVYFVNKGLYTFPIRPFPEIFKINIAFAFLGLPLLVLMYLWIMKQVTYWGKMGIILFLSLLMPIIERFSELLGFFAHSSEWEHIYSFFGYFLFFFFIYKFYQWTNRRN